MARALQLLVLLLRASTFLFDLWLSLLAAPKVALQRFLVVLGCHSSLYIILLLRVQFFFRDCFKNFGQRVEYAPYRAFSDSLRQFSQAYARKRLELLTEGAKLALGAPTGGAGQSPPPESLQKVRALLGKELPANLRAAGAKYLARQKQGCINQIRLLSGALNGQRLDPKLPCVRVSPGGSIKGEVEILVRDCHGRGAVFPIGWTPSWGDHQRSARTVSRDDRREQSKHKVAIEIQAPSEAGYYFIAFACAAQMRVSNIMSATAWMRRRDKWDDENDIADLSWPQIGWGIEHGWFPLIELDNHDKYGAGYYGGTAIVIEVAK